MTPETTMSMRKHLMVSSPNEAVPKIADDSRCIKDPHNMQHTESMFYSGSLDVLYSSTLSRAPMSIFTNLLFPSS